MGIFDHALHVAARLPIVNIGERVPLADMRLVPSPRVLTRIGMPLSQNSTSHINVSEWFVFWARSHTQCYSQCYPQQHQDNSVATRWHARAWHARCWTHTATRTLKGSNWKSMDDVKKESSRSADTDVSWARCVLGLMCCDDARFIIWRLCSGSDLSNEKDWTSWWIRIDRFRWERVKGTCGVRNPQAIKATLKTDKYLNIGEYTIGSLLQDVILKTEEASSRNHIHDTNIDKKKG